MIQITIRLNSHTHNHNVVGLVAGRAAPFLVNNVKNLFLFGHWLLVDFEQQFAEALAHKFLAGFNSELVLETIGEGVEAVALPNIDGGALERVEALMDANRHSVGFEHLDFAVTDEHKRIVGTCV